MVCDRIGDISYRRAAQVFRLSLPLMQFVNAVVLFSATITYEVARAS